MQPSSRIGVKFINLSEAKSCEDAEVLEMGSKGEREVDKKLIPLILIDHQIDKVRLHACHATLR